MLWGCTSKKISSCTAIQELNTELTENVSQYLNSENLQEIKIVADAFTQVQEKLSNLIKDETLSEFTQELGDIYRQYSEVTNQYLVAYEKRDRDKIIESKEKLKQLFQEQTQIIKQINSYCVN